MTTTLENNIEKVAAALERNFKEGILKAALLLQREAQLRTPVDTGALRASAYTRKSREDDFEIEYEVGFTQNYGLYVHENMDAFHAVGQAKFLEEPARTIKEKLGFATIIELRSPKYDIPEIRAV